ncbi:MAG: hypothetical protein J6R85_06085 [Lentisphaeria bacterium]|nr:hypothetical protein [Lentisphaeria bacterium]
MKSPKTEVRRNFSLIEVIVATALLSLVGMIIGVSIHTFHRSYDKAQKVAQWLERNQAIDRIAENALKSIVPFHWLNTETGETELVFQGDEEELWLTAMNRAYGDQGAFRFIRLYVEDEKLYCDYSKTPLLPWKELIDQKYETELITDGVAMVTFQYAEYDEDGMLTWLDLWDEEEKTGLPLAIQMTVEWTDGTKERWMRRTAGTSTNTEYLSTRSN